MSKVTVTRPLILGLMLWLTFQAVPAYGLSGVTQNASLPPLTLPATPASNQFKAWFAAFSTGDRVTLRQFLVEHRGTPRPGAPSTDIVTNRQLAMYKETQGFDLGRVMNSSTENITVAARARDTGYWVAITLTVAPQPPHEILTFGFRHMEAPVDLLPHTKLTGADVKRRLDDLITKLIAEDAFSGAILLAKDGKPLYERVSGLASRTWNIPNRLDTKFNLASMGKMFTAIAVAQLAEQGKLSYQDKVVGFLPDYPNKDVAEKVTVHQLMSHTSGLPLEDRPATGVSPKCLQVFRTITEYVACLPGNESLKFEPGTKYEYSNYGYLLLGAIIEKASGQNYYDYIREHIYKPAGMTNSDSYELNTDPPNLASGYEDGPNGSRLNNILKLPPKGMPFGMGYSTVEDLLKFHAALGAGILLNAKSLNLVWTGKVDAYADNQYGYGFFVKQYNGMRIVSHGGGWDGITNEMDMYPDLGYTVVILNNIDSRPSHIIYKLREWLTQGQPVKQ